VKFVTGLFVLFIIIVIILADMDQLGFFVIINKIPYGDKIGHFILYGILTLLLDLTLIRSFPNRSPKLIALSTGLTLALLIGLEEFSQKYFSSRTFSFVDLAASYLGVLFFSWFVLRISTINKKTGD